MTRAAIGVALVAAHAAAYAALAARCGGAELAVELRAPLVAPGPAPSIEGSVPAALAARVESRLEGDAPGLVRRAWTARYRGGFARTVGAAQLVGPLQDPAARACTGRVVVGQRLLDDGRAGPGTVAHELLRALEAELRGQRVVGAGDFVRVEGVALRWAELARHPEDLTLAGAAPHGYVRATARLVFERIEVPLVIALRPEASAAELRFRVAIRAALDFDNRVLQWLSDRLGGDGLATRLAQRQVDASLVGALAPPPPLELPGGPPGSAPGGPATGSTLRFGYCGGPPEIVEGAYGALPFTVELGRRDGAPAVLPPRRGPAPRARLAPGAALGIDLDLDALNALLHELWRAGYLERRLVEAGLDRRFNADPIVAEYLSIRISPLALPLPPVLAPVPGGLRLSADARTTITDGGAATVGRVWGGLDFAFGRRVDEPVAVDLAALELSCERGPSALAPCYAELVGAMRDRGAELHGELTRAFAALLADLFVDRRLGASSVPAELVIRGAVPRLVLDGAGGPAGGPAAPRNASLHLELDAAIAPPPAAP